MEAIGTLAGGIAHDFNNILGVILNNLEVVGIYTEFLSQDVDHHISESLNAAKRAADLTSRY